MEAAAQSNLKRVTLELGGKSPNIVFKDADRKFYIPDCLKNKGAICKLFGCQNIALAFRLLFNSLDEYSVLAFGSLSITKLNDWFPI